MPVAARTSSGGADCASSGAVTTSSAEATISAGIGVLHQDTARREKWEPSMSVGADSNRRPCARPAQGEAGEPARIATRAHAAERSGGASELSSRSRGCAPSCCAIVPGAAACGHRLGVTPSPHPTGGEGPWGRLGFNPPPSGKEAMTECAEFEVRRQNRATLARISSAVLVQMNGRGCRSCSARYAWMRA